MSDIIETIDEALSDWAVSPDAMRWTPDSAKVEPVPGIAPGLTGFRQRWIVGVPPPTVRITANVRAFQDAMARVAESLAAIDWDALRRLTKMLQPPRPPHQPAALCIDGHEYRRRQRARKGRR